MKYIALLAATVAAQSEAPATANWIATGTANFTAWIDKDDRAFVRYQAWVPKKSWLAIAFTDKTYKKGDNENTPAMQGDFFWIRTSNRNGDRIEDNEVKDYNGDKDGQPSREDPGDKRNVENFERWDRDRDGKQYTEFRWRRRLDTNQGEDTKFVCDKNMEEAKPMEYNWFTKSNSREETAYETAGQWTMKFYKDKDNNCQLEVMMSSAVRALASLTAMGAAYVAASL